MRLCGWLILLGGIAGCLTQIEGERSGTRELGYTLTDVTTQAKLQFVNYFGGETSKRYILETTGSGAAFFDYDGDGWLDIFLVNGSRLEGFPSGQEPTNRLFHNNKDGTFRDVTAKAELTRHGWGQGVCVGDVDNDGHDDLYVTYWGHNVLYHNNGNGTFRDISKPAGVEGASVRWGTGCSFVDYDRDGHLDLFVTNYIVFDPKTAPDPGSNPYCVFLGLSVNCGPRGSVGESPILYHNNGDGTFTDVSERSGVARASNRYGLGVLTGDFDNDGWPDIYVANDTTPSVLFHNNHDGTFTDIALLAGCATDENGREQAGMGVAAGDYNADGWLDIFKTNFSDEAPNLYRNQKGAFSDDTLFAGTGVNRRWVGWGGGFFDPDNDGWLDIFYGNGHVYPELDRTRLDTHYREPRALFRNLGNGRFEDASAAAGPSITTPTLSRGVAFGDYDNDGDTDVLVNNMNGPPSLLRCDRTNTSHHWLTVQLTGSKSNRDAIGARVRCVTGNHSQIDEVRSGGSYLSQNDFRIHFGLGTATAIDRLEVAWPSGRKDVFTDIPVDALIGICEGDGKPVKLR